MAFSLQNSEESAPISEINTTPLVDVMLVLLVLFLVTTPMMVQGVKVNLPQQTTQKLQQKKPTLLSIKENGDFYWVKEKISLDALEISLKKLAKKNPKAIIHLYADKKVSYEEISTLLALTQQNGLKQIGFIMQDE